MMVPGRGEGTPWPARDGGDSWEDVMVGVGEKGIWSKTNTKQKQNERR